MRVRLIDWNTCYQHQPGPKVDLLRWTIDEFDGDVAVVVLQEVMPSSRAAFESLFADGAVAYSLGLRRPDDFDGENRRQGVMVGTMGAELVDARLVTEAPYPDRTLSVTVRTQDSEFAVLGAHGLTGVGYKHAKSDQLRALTRHLVALEAAGPPCLLALDANEPMVDAWTLSESEFAPNREGGKGARMLLGADAPHRLVDSLRVFLGQNLAMAESACVARPDGPLEISYKTKARLCRYDQCWVSRHWSVSDVDYRYEPAIEAGSDHALLVVDLELGAGTA